MPPELATAPPPAPDPNTNSDPGHIVTDESASGVWDYLDTPVDDRETAPDEFEEDRPPLDPDEEPVGDDGKPEGETETKPETPAEPEADKPTAADLIAEIPAEVQQKTALFDEFDQTLQSNPEAVAGAILDRMDPHTRAELLKQYIGDVTPPATFDVANYEPNGEMETALRDRWNDIDAIPQIATDARLLKQEIGQTRQQFDDTRAVYEPQMAEANIVGQIALRKIDAICEALGIDLPDPDVKALQAAFNGGKESYRNAVRKVLDYKSMVDTFKQITVRRPQTPGNGTKRTESFKEGTDAVTIARAMGTIPRRR
jgi:hypothetical protein